MKKGVLFLATGVLGLLFQAKLSANITGSPHDFSGVSFVHGEGEICKVCHTPHNAGSNQVPLWRGSLSSSVIYTLYSSDTLDATPNQPMVPSKACLTCHDGTIALGPVTGCTSCHNAHGSQADLALHDDHPISFTYDHSLAQADGALFDPANTPVASLGGKTIQEGMLFEDRMECSSCHDVHAAKGDSGLTANLLLVDNNQSNLCLTCHNK